MAITKEQLIERRDGLQVDLATVEQEIASLDTQLQEKKAYGTQLIGAIQVLNQMISEME
jgi:hypothetical protein